MTRHNHTIELTRLSLAEIRKEKNLFRKMEKIGYFAQQCRLDVFNMLYSHGNGHWGGSASVAEILASLYGHIMNYRPDEPAFPDRDRLVLSKGHAAPMLYTILAQAGFFPCEELRSFRKLNSRLQGHPSFKSTPGVDASTGPLGHGISIGTGMAMASKILGKKYWTFVIVGDGCLNEGQSWEGIMSAAKFRPPRLLIMVDYNKVQLDGKSEEIMPMDPLADKFKAFNLNVADKIYDGHLVSDVFESWEWARKNQNDPCVIIYKTHKGKGVSFMEDNHKWHGSTIDEKSYILGKAELLNKLESLTL